MFIIVKAAPNPVEVLVDILDGAFEVSLLFPSKIESGGSVIGLTLSMLRIE